jgi:hypothetical protein
MGNDNKMIGKCKQCKEDYCMNCATNEKWLVFCSIECEIEWEAEEMRK